MNSPASLFTHALDLADFPKREELWAALPGGGGVYALCDDHDRLILLATAQSLRRTVRHRLSEPQPDAAPTKRADLAAVTRRIHWRPTHSRFESTLVYYRLARTLHPNRYRKMVGFGPAWFIHFDPHVPLPRFEPTSRVYQQPGMYWGPYATRGDAAEVVADLENLFDLCRYHDILDKSPHGQACAYLEMGKCPAPCDGSVPADIYRTEHCEPARAFLWGNRARRIDHWRRLMDAAARELAFERAAILKWRIKRANEPIPLKHALARDADDFIYLVVQRAGGTSWLRPFFVTRGRIETADRVRRKTLSEVLPSWCDALTAQRKNGPGNLDPVQRSEQAWLVSHFLFQGDAAPGCFLHQSQLQPDVSALERLHRAFPAGSRRSKKWLANPEAEDNIRPDGLPPAVNGAGHPDHSTDKDHPEPDHT